MANNSVVVWSFPNSKSREKQDFSLAQRLGIAGTHQELVDFQNEYGDYLGYTDPNTDQWLSYAQAEKRFGEEPWVSM